MAQAREHARPSPAKASRATKSGPASNLAARQSVRVHAGAAVADVSVTKARFERIVHKKRMLGKMISGYADAVDKAKRTGRDYIISYRVTPDGKAEKIIESVTQAPAADALAGAVSAARARGQGKIADILNGQDMLTAREFAPLIGTTHETVNTKRKTGELLGLEGATRGVRYPRWQVTDAGLPLQGLPDLFAALGAQPWTVYRFLRAAHAELGGRTGLDALKAGQVEAVLGVARNQAVGAFS